MTKPKNKKFSIERLLLGALLVVVVLILGYVLAYRPYQIQQERKRFQDAEASIDQLANEIQTKVGKATQVEKERYCQRANLKNARGPLSCVVGYNLLFSDQSTESATKIMKDVNLITGSPDLMLLGDKVDGFKSVSEFGGEQDISQKYSDINSLSCSIQYSYQLLPSTAEYFHANTNAILVNVSCLGWPRTDLYPIKP